MTDYTPGETNAADDLLDQMLTATHTELLTTIAAKQAGTTGSAGLDCETPGPLLVAPRVPSGHIAWTEENQNVAKLALTLLEMQTVLDHLVTVAPDGVLWEWAAPIGKLLARVAEGLSMRTVSQRTLLNLLDQVQDVADVAEATLDAEIDCAERLKALLPQAYEGVRYLFDPSDDTVSCPVS